MSAATTIMSTRCTKAKVVLDADRRKAIILADAKDLAFAQGLTLVEDEGLLEEVAGLVEWPVVLMGEFEPAFLDLPPEVIRATIRANQKCFVLREAPAPSVMAGAGHDAGESGGRLANKFILVSNLVASDGGAAIAAGNGRVVRARLADARHFWATDLAPLPDAKDKSREAARPAPGEDSTRGSCSTRSSARRTSGSRASTRWRASSRRSRRRSRASSQARGATRQGRPCDRDGRRVPRATGPDGSLLRARAG